MIEIIEFNNGKLRLLDQRKLPDKVEYLKISDTDGVSDAIKNMVVRGAPAIGIAAAYGYCLGVSEKKFRTADEMKNHMKAVKKKLLQTRPTAVNLAWALDKMDNEFSNLHNVDQRKVFVLLEEAANKIKFSEIEANRAIGMYGAKLLEGICGKSGKVTMLTHCNAGALATGGWGTALGVARSAFEKGFLNMVYVDETRPRLQGARLTCFELESEKIPYRLITDNMAGYIMSRGLIDVVIVGADRIAVNGDTANKIGTYMVAVLAQRHGIPFYVAAPKSTFDMRTPDGSGIKVEQRDENEVLFFGNKRICPEAAKAENPAFDITPHELVTAYITEEGVIKQT